MAEEMEYELNSVNVASAAVLSFDEKGNIEIIDRGVIKFREENEILAVPTMEAALELLKGTNVMLELDSSGILFLLGPNSTTMFISMGDGTQEKVNLPADISKDAIDAVKSIPADEPDRVSKIYEVLKEEHNISIDYDSSSKATSKEPNENSIERVTTQEGQVIDGDKGSPNLTTNDHNVLEEGAGNKAYEYTSRRTSKDYEHDGR